LRTFFAITALLGGSIIFAGDPSHFVRFSFCAIPGTITLASALLLIGLALWIRE
jgi:hypothetical protein